MTEEKDIHEQLGEAGVAPGKQMTKQEEIRERMTDIIKESVPCYIYPFLIIPTRWLVNKLLRFLHSQGVVIKEVRKLPEYAPFPGREPKPLEGAAFLLGMDIGRENMVEAGYVAVEPLIKGEADDTD